MKKKIKKLSLISSLFGLFALCGLLSLNLFSSRKEVAESKAINENVMSSLIFYDEHVTVPYNKVVNGAYTLTRNVDYHLSYSASLIRRVDYEQTSYYVRIEFSYMVMGTQVTLDSTMDAYFRPSWSNMSIGQTENLNVGYIITSPMLNSNTSFNFNFWLLNAGIYSNGSTSTFNASYYNTFKIQDTVTNDIYGMPHSSFDMDGNCFCSPADAYLDPLNYPENFRFNFEGGDAQWCLFKTFTFDADTTSYEQGYQYGYNDGWSDAYDIGFQNGLNAGREAERNLIDIELEQARQQGYSEGFQAGVTDASQMNQTALTIFNGILSVGMLPVNFFLSIFNFEIFGINISAFVSALLTIAITIIVVRLVVGGKNGE